MILARQQRFALFIFLAGVTLVTLQWPACSCTFQIADVEKLFSKAMADYQAKAYASAKSGFQQIADLPLNERSAGALLMLAKTDVQLHAFDEAILTARRLLRDFPTSTYADDGRFLLGQCFESQEKYGQAEKEYLALLASDSDARLQTQAQARLEQIKKMSAAKEDQQPARERPIEPPLKQGQPVQSKFCIGVISSLSGEDSEVGREMLRGVQLAVQESNAPGIELVVEDVKSDPVQAVFAVQKLTEQESVLAIIGPVESIATVGAAALANCEQTVLITPTATDDGLADIGPFIWQLNVTPALQGRAMAAYAVDQLGLRHFAVLAVSDLYGKSLAAGFISGLTEHGGSVVAQEWYYEGTTDFTPQLSHVRNAGLGLEQADSLAWAEKMSGLVASGLVDTSARNFIAPVDSIEGFFMAAYGEEIPLIVSQLGLHAIRTQPLGAGSWNSEETVQSGGATVDGAIFTSPSFAGFQSVESTHFMESYWEQNDVKPTRVAALGYDAMKLIMHVLNTGASSSLELRDGLAEMRRFDGASGPIAFSPGRRANSHVFILTIHDGKIIELW